MSLNIGSTEYCFRLLNAPFDNTLRPKLLPIRSDGSLGNLFPRTFDHFEAGNDMEESESSIYLCPPFVEEDMNTELLDDTLDEIFEETDSEDYNENEMEELETEVSEDTEKWANDGDLTRISFEANPRPGIFTVFCHTRKFDRRAERRFHVKLF
ncbi:hypothetical protein AVEN_59615-1 [Araneus ventricosus]|uniref:Uncharacterized protein n=1 Tax=Araneus ventricosus TaxID=182803 RepID=A0A4Y2N396_ARAVE|nr:hypothetical protein AVEN_59615-1 [Araneus ventricosus]